MSFLHSEQPKCNKIFPPFPIKNLPLSYFLPILNHESEDPKCSFFNCPVKCEMSPFPPISGTSLFPLCVCGLEKTCWPG